MPTNNYLNISKSKTINILGAGPAGLTAAINLKKEGYNVRVYEKKSDCGERFRGDFQGLENWSSPVDILEDLKSMNIQINFWNKPIKQAEFYDYKFNKRLVNFERPGLYLIRRGSMTDTLDFGLKKQALEYGVEIIFNHNVKHEDVHIIAGGPKRVDGIVRGIVFSTKTEHLPALILNDDLAPKSFAYLLIGEGRGCLGTGMTNNYTDADKYLDKTIAAFKKIVDLDINDPKRFTGYFNFFLRRSYIEDNKLIVGEEAGLQDYLFAFGLRQAFTSGFLAAKSIIEGENFDHLMKKTLIPKLKTSISNRFFYRILGNKGYSTTLNRGRKIKDPVGKMGRQYNYKAFKKITYPLAKVSLGVKKY